VGTAGHLGIRVTPGRAFGAVAGGIAIALALVSCGERSVGTGVVLWSEGGPAANGATVDVVQESTIEDRYLVRAATADRSQEPVPVPVAPRWRVRVFAEPEQAAAFAAGYAAFVDRYAYAARRGLPVRAEASATAGIIYKLREQEVVKVIARGAEPEQVGAFENHWYEVLTEDGTVGYTFGEFLPVFESSGDPRAEAARLLADDPGLERVLGTAWRPEEFLSMVRWRRFDLVRLRPEYGLFPDPQAGVFRLVTAQRAREFAYRAVERVGDGRYVLATEDGDGSAARFTLRGNGVLAFSYVDEGRQITELFVELEEQVEELIASERARRGRLFASLLKRGPLLRSGGYGTIELTEEGRFHWQGYEALVPRWVPDGLPGTGVVDFRYVLGAPLRGSYDVAVTLLFDGPERTAAAGAGAGAAADGGADAGESGETGGARAVAVPHTGPQSDAPATGSAEEVDSATGEDGGSAAGAGADGTASAGTTTVAADATAGSETGDAGTTGTGTAGTGATDTGTGTAAADTGAGAATAAEGIDAADGVGKDAELGSGGVAGAPAGTGDVSADGEAEVEPEYMRPIAWAAELTLLLSYDGDGIRLTPAEPAVGVLEIRQVNRSAVVMYFATASGGGG
jgi:hypothetical protein